MTIEDLAEEALHAGTCPVNVATVVRLKGSEREMFCGELQVVCIPRR